MAIDFKRRLMHAEVSENMLANNFYGKWKT
jgi:hypothetical protein